MRSKTTIKGVVASWHLALHGEPNGVILETGEVIHLQPHGMVAAGLDIGSKVNAVGELRTTVLRACWKLAASIAPIRGRQ